MFFALAESRKANAARMFSLMMAEIWCKTRKDAFDSLT